MQFPIGVLHKAGHPRELLGDVAVGSRSIAVPPQTLQIVATRHAYECLDLLQALHGVDHLISGLVLFDEPIHQRIDVSPIFWTNVGGVVGEVLEMLVLF